MGTKKMKFYKCYFDGACEPQNPGGAMGIGYTVNDFKDYDFKAPDPENTNNVAEYLAFCKILQHLEGEKKCKINILGDSMLVINQMNGLWKIKKGKYKEIALEAKILLNKLKKDNNIILKWIPRERNVIADELSLKAIYNGRQ